MIKKLIKLNEGLVIYFTKKEAELFGMKEGDKIDLSDMFLTEIKGRKNETTNIN